MYINIMYNFKLLSYVLLKVNLQDPLTHGFTRLTLMTSTKRVRRNTASDATSASDVMTGHLNVVYQTVMAYCKFLQQLRI